MSSAGRSAGTIAHAVVALLQREGDTVAYLVTDAVLPVDDAESQSADESGAR